MPNPPTTGGVVGPAEGAVVSHDGVLVIVGPNGSGKTRLGAALEMAHLSTLPGQTAEGGPSGPRAVVRIGAQRAIALPETVPLLSQADAESQFQAGGPNRGLSRVQGDPATGQMQDYAALVQLLFAQQNATANAFHAAVWAAVAGQSGDGASAQGAPPQRAPVVEVPESVLERVVATWESLFPHRRLVARDQRLRARAAAPDLLADLGASGVAVMEGMQLFGARALVSPTGGPPGEPPADYGAGQISDGERAGFYLIAHVLLAGPGMTLLVDEPETYLHPDLQRRLWDALEAVRPDCAFVYLTHNLEFAASRRGAPKIVVRDYRPQHLVLTGAQAAVAEVSYPVVANRGPFWTWEVVAPAAGVPEDVVLRIAGARRPTLFVEGEADSLDAPLYRALYPGYEVVPAGPCEVVIRNVRALRAVARAHHLAPVGLIDPDDRGEAERARLARDRVYALAYAQVENVYLDERVFRAVLAYLREPDPDVRFADLRQRVARRLDRERDALVQRRALRALDRRVAAWAAPAGAAPPPADETAVAAAFARAVGGGDPARVVTEAFADAARAIDAARTALAASCTRTPSTAAAPAAPPTAANSEAGPNERHHESRRAPDDARDPCDLLPGDPAYRQALIALRNKGVEADAAAAAGVHGPERYRRLALVVLSEQPHVRAVVMDTVPVLPDP